VLCGAEGVCVCECVYRNIGECVMFVIVCVCGFMGIFMSVCVNVCAFECM